MLAASLTVNAGRSVPDRILCNRDSNGPDFRPPKPESRWSILTHSWQGVLARVRNLFLPLYNQRPAEDERAKNGRLAAEICRILKNPDAACPPNLAKKLEHIRGKYLVYDVDVELKRANRTEIFVVRVIESENVRFILFSFSNNKEYAEDEIESRKWAPLNGRELNAAPIAVLKALQESSVKVDSLFTNSLGNIALSGFSYFPDVSMPKMLVINRGLSSVKEALYYACVFPLSYFLYLLAKACGWDANPSNDLTNLLRNNPETKVVALEVQKDFYFPEGKLRSLQAPLFYASFWGYPIQQRAQHATTLDNLEKNSESRIFKNTMGFKLEEYEKLSEALARNILLDKEGEKHTAFYIAGADGDLDIATVRDIKPLADAVTVLESTLFST